MGTEIERKYLIREGSVNYATDALLQIYHSIEAVMSDVLVNGKQIQQGYLSLDSGSELSDKLDMNVDFDPTEARIRDKGGKMFFTLKGKGGLSRNELEVEIDRTVFDEYWSKTEGKRVQKYRLAVPFEDHTLEIDVYTDRLLVVAEIEVPTLEEAQRLSAIGKDVTEDKAYKNRNLAK